MDVTRKFLDFATREIACIDSDDIRDRVAGALAGAIEQNLAAHTRDCFIKAGLVYLDLFDQYADQAIEHERCRAEGRSGGKRRDGATQRVISEIRQLKTESLRVRPSEFFEALAADWDERHQDDNDSRPLQTNARSRAGQSTSRRNP